MGVEKDKVSLGSTHKQPEFLQNKGKTNKTIIGLITGIGLKLDKKLLLHKEKTPKGQMVPYSRSHSIGVPESKKCWRREVAEAHKCWTFDIFEVHEAQNAGFLGRGRFSKHKNAGNSGGLYLHEVQKRLRHEKPGTLGSWSTKMLEILESGTLWGANFAKKIAKHGGHACLEVTRKNFTFVNFFRATSEAKSHYFPSGSLLFFPKSARNLLEKWHFWCQVGPL